jgi:haloalkane dehalogenase
MVPIAQTHRVLALDLPGFGDSDKPTDGYTFRFYREVLTGFLDTLGIDRVGLGVHDLGGPVGLSFAVHAPQRVAALALLNTLVYPKLSWAAAAFLLGCRLPLVRGYLTSPAGLKTAMKLGMARRDRLTQEVLDGVCRPFVTPEARKALGNTAVRLSPRGLAQIAERLPTLKVPVRILYGAADRILPDVAETMAQVKRDLPQAEVTVLPGCGHFLQEDDPDQVGALLAAFFAASLPATRATSA